MVLFKMRCNRAENAQKRRNAKLDKTEIVKRLENIAKHAVHVIGEPPFIMSLDDGIALAEAVLLLKEQEEGKWIYGEDETGVDGWHCSECGFFEPWFYEFTDDIDFIRFYGFCPSCGRKMTSYTAKSVQEGR